MASKRQRLQVCTKAELKSLANEYGIECEPFWRKENYIEVMSRSRKFNLDGIEEILKKTGEAGSVREAVRSAKQDFFNDTAGRVFKQHEELAATMSNAIAIAEIIDSGYITSLRTQAESLRNSDVNKIEVPSHIGNQWSRRQWNAFGVAKKVTYYVPRFVNSASSSALSDGRVSEYDSWRRRKLPDRVGYYLFQAYRSYIAKCYDGCIVMLARAIEYSLKEVLKSKTAIRPTAALGELIGLYKNKIGNDRTVQKILEVQNMERVICAHDKPPYEKIMQAEDADHAWTAIEIVLRDLLLLSR